jgi:hypothetical protein
MFVLSISRISRLSRTGLQVRRIILKRLPYSGIFRHVNGSLEDGRCKNSSPRRKLHSVMSGGILGDQIFSEVADISSHWHRRAITRRQRSDFHCSRGKANVLGCKTTNNPSRGPSLLPLWYIRRSLTFNLWRGYESFPSAAGSNRTGEQ